MTLKVKLDEQTMRNAEVEAQARSNASRMAGIVDQRVGSLSGNVADLVGLLGEIGTRGAARLTSSPMTAHSSR
jgi:hypothetical protein